MSQIYKLNHIEGDDIKHIYIFSNDDSLSTPHYIDSYGHSIFSDEEIENINNIYLDISEDLHTLNMYNRIYVPEKFRFFFPPEDIDFCLETNVGQIKTHITANGYFTKGMRSWVEVNGPLQPTDQICISIINEKHKMYEMTIANNLN